MAPIVWEDVACPLCKAHNEEVVLWATGEPGRTTYRLVRCRSCGLGYLNPRPDQISIGRFYGDDYKPFRPRRPQHTGWWGPRRAALKRLVLRDAFNYPPPLGSWRQRLLAALCGPLLSPHRDSHQSIPYHGEGRLLDLGCGSGWFLQRMREKGWQVLGVDVSDRAAQEAGQAYGIPVHVGTLPHPDVGPETFDVVNMASVLEHVHWPHRVVEGAARALRPGGLLVVSVPNFDSWTLRQFCTACFHLDLPRHLLHFNPVTLRRLLHAHGLEVCELRMMRRVSWMRQTLRTALSQNVPGRGRRLLLRAACLGPLTSLLTSWTAWTRQADCLLAVARRPARPASYRASA